MIREVNTDGPPYPQYQLSTVYGGPKKMWKIKEINSSLVSKRAPRENGP